MTCRIASKGLARLQASTRSVRFAAVSAIALAAGEVLADLATWVWLDIASIYGTSLVVAAFARSRRLLWALTAALTAATFAAYALQAPAGTFAMREALFVNRALDIVALVIIACLVDLQIRLRQVREAQLQLLAQQNQELERANELLVAHEAQIVAQNEELNRRRREAEEANGRKSRILRAVSHDIRNPASTINLMAEVILRAAEDPALADQVPGLARRLQSNARSLVALVSEVLDIGYLDSGQLQRNDTIFSLNEFIDGKHRDLAALAEAKSLELQCEIPEHIVRVRIDRVKLDRIVTNLMTNAVKFTASGSVTLSASVTAQAGAAIRVRDTGTGIAEKDLDRIFEEFAQVDVPPGGSTGGWGLGLAISRRLASFIGASIHAQSELGRGTTFTVLLPPDAVIDVAAGCHGPATPQGGPDERCHVSRGHS